MIPTVLRDWWGISLEREAVTVFALCVVECDLDCPSVFTSTSDDYTEARRQAAEDAGWAYYPDSDEDVCDDHPILIDREN